MPLFLPAYLSSCLIICLPTCLSICLSASALCVGDKYFQRDHGRIAETYREIKRLEDDVAEGIYGAQARLTMARTNTGFSFGDCRLMDISYIDIRNLVRTAQCHEKLLGIAKKDFFGGLHKLLGPSAIPFLRRADERQEMCTRTSELQRPFKKYFPSSGGATSKPLSGCICEDTWNIIEVYGPLSLSPGSACLPACPPASLPTCLG